MFVSPLPGALRWRVRHSEGLTLVEVLVALFILAVGVIAAATMQTTALRATHRGNIVQELTQLADAELEMQRQLETPTAGNTCLSGGKTGFSCSTVTVPCKYVPASTTLECAASTSVAEQIAYQTTVTVRGPNSDIFSLTSLIPIEVS